MKKILNKVLVILFIIVAILFIKNETYAVEISSNFYKFNYEKNIISRIEPETTIETFKSKMSTNEVKVYKNEECTEEVKEGFVGTGMVLVFKNEKYQLSVVGDFNGDGKATQVELTNIIRHIVGLQGANLEGIYYETGDLTGDGLVDQRDITKYIKYIVYGELDLGKVDNIPPYLEMEILKKTSNEIKLEAKALDKESGMGENPIFTFYVKKANEPDSSYVQKQSGTNSILDLTQLEQDTEYEIKVVTKDKSGNEASKTIKVSTLKMPDVTQEGIITFGTILWNNGKASVDVNTNTEYFIEYQINGTAEGKWIRATQEGTSITATDLNHNDVIYARLTDGNNISNTITLQIKDEVKPHVTLNLQMENYKVTATAEAQDNETGIATNAVYTFYVKESEAADSTYAQKQSTTQKICVFEDLEVGKNYTIKVEVSDIAGNIGNAEQSIKIEDKKEPQIELSVT